MHKFNIWDDANIDVIRLVYLFIGRARARVRVSKTEFSIERIIVCREVTLYFSLLSPYLEEDCNSNVLKDLLLDCQFSYGTAMISNVSRDDGRHARPPSLGPTLFSLYNDLTVDHRAIKG